MRQELEEIIAKKYSKLFINNNKSPRETLICFGCECGDGWYNVLDYLFGYITDLMERKLVVEYSKEYKDQHRDKKDFYENYCSYKFLPPQIVLDQVKEKFGTLRVYYHANFEDVSQDVFKIINAEEYNKKIAEYYEKIEHAIDYAEYQSGRTCEVTGGEGKLYTKGWMRVLCDEEAIKKGYIPKEDGGKYIKENL